MKAPFLVDRAVVAERPAVRLTELAAPLFTALTALADTGLARGPWLAGNPPRESVAGSAETVAAWLERLTEARRRGEFEAAALATKAAERPVTVYAAPDGTGRLTVPVPAPEPPVETVMALVSAAAIGFGAYHAHIDDTRLRHRYFSERAGARAASLVPEEYRRYVPEPEVFAEKLPELLLEDEYDRRKVPAGVWWVNYWDAEQVRTVGVEAIRDAGWARRDELPGGGWLLAATEEPLDPDRPDHLARLRTLLDRLRLAELQRRHPA
jgi:hypothetical protein